MKHYAFEKHWTMDQAESNKIDELEKSLNEILDKLTDDERKVIKESLDYSYESGGEHMRDEYAGEEI